MEDRLKQQRQAAPEPRETPWYNRVSTWVIGLLVIVVAFVGWLFSRRSQASLAEAEAAAEESLRSIQSEAEDVLRVLAEDENEAGEEAAEAAEEPEDTEEAEEGGTTAGRPQPAQDDAELLDEDSSDPEIQLDLARAYISMGDKEAARVILEEVVNNGNEEQQAEAQKMLEVLANQ